MKIHRNQADPFCPGCGGKTTAEYVFCPTCGACLGGSIVPPDAPEEPDAPLEERQGSEELLDHWSMWVAGALLLIASLAAFYVGLVVFGALVGWASGVGVFVLGLVLAGRILGGTGKRAL